MKELMQGGYLECRIEAHGERKRRVCWLTPAGEEAFRTGARVWQKMLPQLEASVTQALQSNSAESMSARK